MCVYLLCTLFCGHCFYFSRQSSIFYTFSHQPSNVPQFIIIIVFYCRVQEHNSSNSEVSKKKTLQSHDSSHDLSFVSFKFIGARRGRGQWFKYIERSELCNSTHRHVPSSSHSPMHSDRTCSSLHYLYMYVRTHV